MIFECDVFQDCEELGIEAEIDAGLHGGRLGSGWQGALKGPRLQSARLVGMAAIGGKRLQAGTGLRRMWCTGFPVFAGWPANLCATTARKRRQKIDVQTRG